MGTVNRLESLCWFELPSDGAVIAPAMLTNLIAGALGGILIPQLLNRFRIDPAVSSSAFATTVTDVAGYGSLIAMVWFG